MSENKLKHLEFIQNVITRMNTNSFMIKGWTLTLVSALLALSAQAANFYYSFICYAVIVVFWFLDGFFLATERQYRGLYNAVRLKQEGDIDFDMNASSFNVKNNRLIDGICSKTLLLYYGIILVATMVISCVMKTSAAIQV